MVAIKGVNGGCVFLPAPPACIRICVRGEKAPELVLELQDDERSQSFFSQVKRAKQQGEPVSLSLFSLTLLNTAEPDWRPYSLGHVLFTCTASGYWYISTFSSLTSNPCLPVTDMFKVKCTSKGGSGSHRNATRVSSSTHVLWCCVMLRLPHLIVSGRRMFWFSYFRG